MGGWLLRVGVCVCDYVRDSVWYVARVCVCMCVPLCGCVRACLGLCVCRCNTVLRLFYITHRFKLTNKVK